MDFNDSLFSLVVLLYSFRNTLKIISKAAITEIYRSLSGGKRLILFSLIKEFLKTIPAMTPNHKLLTTAQNNPCKTPFTWNAKSFLTALFNPKVTQTLFICIKM